MLHPEPSPDQVQSESRSVVSDSLRPHGLYSPWNLQARILEWVAFPFSKGSSQPRDQTQASRIARGFFTSWATKEAQEYQKVSLLQGIFLIRELNWGLLHCRWILFFFFFSWRLITLQYCSGFCHTLIWISHGFTCVPHPEPFSHLPPHPIPLDHPSAPALSICLMHQTWTGDLFHIW